MPASAAADGAPSSSAPRRNGAHVRDQSRRRVPRVPGRRAPHDRARRSRRSFGRLVATSSLASLFGTARNEHYAATKAAINALCRALAVELARHGVTANAILPGWIKSDMTAGIMANEKFVANVMPRIPVRRFGEPEDFGGIAVYLMSKASSYHTADCFVIDGGYRPTEQRQWDVSTMLKRFLDRVSGLRRDEHGLDELRALEYGRLDSQGHAYLDYTGAGLHADSQVREHAELLRKGSVRQPAFRATRAR